MAAWLTIIVGMVYAIIAVDLLMKGQGYLSLTFAAYALANVGLWGAQR